MRLASALLLVCLACAPRAPLVVLVALDGPPRWDPGLLVGGGDHWRAIPHADSLAGLLAGVVEGFPTPWVYGPPGHLRGQGNLLTLAGREGWATAVCASPRMGMESLVEPLVASASWAKTVAPGADSWRDVLRAFSGWVYSGSTRRFAFLQVSLDLLPAGRAGQQALFEFWSELETIVARASPTAALVAVFLPHPVEEGSLAWVRCWGPVPGASLSREVVLSTLDVAPTVASVLELLYTPDYPGQALAALGAGGRTEPVSFTRGQKALVLDTRWLVEASPVADTSLASCVRFLDLWSHRWSVGALDDPRALSLLRWLPPRSQAIHQEP